MRPRWYCSPARTCHVRPELNGKGRAITDADFLNLADGAEPQPLGNCSHDLEIIALLKKITRRYADEVKQALEVMSTANPRTIIELRRQLTE